VAGLDTEGKTSSVARLVGVVPAAGRATRLQPLVGSKEVLPVGGRPVMDYLLDRLEAAGCDEIRVVTRPDKQDVAGHAAARGARVIEGQPECVAASLRLGTAGLRDVDTVLFGFPDSLWEPVDGFMRLLAALGDGTDVALGLFACRELERSDVVVVGADGRVHAVHVKPRRPPAQVVWGCAAALVAALDGLDRHAEPGFLFDELARDGRVRGVSLEGEFVDIGTPAALARLGVTA
jgi:glucose-1-phosphate thymidylyltransferase